MKKILFWLSLLTGITFVFGGICMSIVNIWNFLEPGPYPIWLPLVTAITGIGFLIVALIITITELVSVWSTMSAQDRKKAIREAAWWVRFAYGIYQGR